MQLEETQLREVEKDLTASLEEIREEVLHRASARLDRAVSMQSLHATIGGKYRTLADVVHVQFSSPDEMIARWLLGLREAAQEEVDADVAKYGRAYRSGGACRLADLLQDELIWKYTRLFHERSFFRHLKERTRAKPGEELWTLWFGNNQLVWGLLIAPDFRAGAWRNDVSEIRKKEYSYWTVGHVLEEGLIDPDQPTPYRFSKVDDFLQFYRSVLKRISNSIYERPIYEFYESYLDASADPLTEPFLVPELRYRGLEREHQYRLDLTVVNPYTMRATGFELSPASTHMAVSGMAKKTQALVNQELAKKWEREMAKRRDYFETFGIRIDSFTDGQLRNLPWCFDRIRAALAERPEGQLRVQTELDAVRAV